jgi:tRNA isopentenyl-2-thiomethyl-A-37 hydroxylase MiaE
MINKIIDVNVEDTIRKEELYHDRQLKKALEKYNIDFDIQTISPYGMRAKTKNKKLNHK